MALSAERVERLAENRRQLAAMSPEVSRDVARWLREDIAPGLPSERQRALAERSASRFEQRASEPG